MLATSGSGRTGGNPNQRRFRPLGDVPLFEKMLRIYGLAYILAVESGYEEGCKWGAILMAASNSFKVSFRLVHTREKAGKIRLSLFPILD